MQIVIDIPESLYKATINGLNSNEIWDLRMAVSNGKQLPKGHGKLIDADELEPKDISPEAWYSPMWGFELVDIEDAPIIIEADKTESEIEQ